jgi:hypothetical protein
MKQEEPYNALEADPYRPVSRRRRLLIGLLAIATAITVVLTLLYPPGGIKRHRPAVPVCSDGQGEGCVGGRVEMINVAPEPPAEVASAPR